MNPTGGLRAITADPRGIVNLQHRLPMAEQWGDGSTSSSDGQAFPIAMRRPVIAQTNAKYGRDPVVTFYTHISDRYAPFHTKAISSTVRDGINAERPGHTLTPTALVHEAYLRFGGEAGLHFSDRLHFFAVLAQAMRRVLVDYARRKRAVKRGGTVTPLVDPEWMIAVSESDETILALDEALLPKLRYEPQMKIGKSNGLVEKVRSRTSEREHLH